MLEVTQLGNPSGNTVIILSGYMFGNWVMKPMAKHMPDANVILISDLGTGYKNIAESDISATLDSIDAVINDLGVDEFHLAGHSMGGFVAQIYATLRKHKIIKSLILLGSCHLEEFKHSYRNNSEHVLKDLFSLDDDTFFKFTTFSAFSPEFMAGDNLSVLQDDFLSAMPKLEDCSKQHILLKSVNNWFASSNLSVDAEILNIYALGDKIVKPEWAEKYTTYNDHVKNHSVAGSHMFMYESPEEIAQIMSAWCNRF